MNIDNGVNFVVSFVPETINGEKNVNQKENFVQLNLMTSQKFGLQQKAKLF
jgi:hypothetical protein